MVFNSLTFALFFAIVLAVHHLPLPWTIRKINLLIASYLFYAAWNPPFVTLLVAAAVIDFRLARWMDRSSSQAWRRSLLIFSLALNLGLLGFFKYGNFMLENFEAFMATLGVRYVAPKYSVILPLGISFYTFETISYLIDVYRRRIAATRSFLDYALFLTFFPHLVAGPIVRAHDFLPQCRVPVRANRAQLGWGLFMMVLGLFEKVVLADGMLAKVADKAFSAASSSQFLDAWIGTFAFAGQIFFDFAGYSTCGIGAALCLGFVLTDNFRFPYAAIGFSDFWQRWHISLSTWLRDYLYIPLGGNRQGPARTHVNLMTTMVIGGLWHGAAWRFIAWGAVHGFYLIAERVIRSRLPAPSDEPRELGTPLKLMLMLGTFLLVCLTWVLFRANTFQDALQFLLTMSRPTIGLDVITKTEALVVLLVTSGLLLSHWWLRDSSLEEAVGRLPWWVRSILMACLMFGLALAPGDDRAFIYFQF